MSDEDLDYFNKDPQIANNGAERGENIAKVADKKKTGVYKVLTDDNLGSAF